MQNCQLTKQEPEAGNLLLNISKELWSRFTHYVLKTCFAISFLQALYAGANCANNILVQVAYVLMVLPKDLSGYFQDFYLKIINKQSTCWRIHYWYHFVPIWGGLYGELTNKIDHTSWSILQSAQRPPWEQADFCSSSLAPSQSSSRPSLSESGLIGVFLWTSRNPVTNIFSLFFCYCWKPDTCCLERSS